MAIVTNSENDEWKRLREPEVVPPRALTIGTLLFAFFFCALVFSAGWREAAAYQRCGLKGVLTAAGSCHALTAKSPAPEAAPAR